MGTFFDNMENLDYPKEMKNKVKALYEVFKEAFRYYKLLYLKKSITQATVQ